ncbi:site-specific integrase [Photobacterium damselae]|uniref:site-specific integrase n=1 Tax=Photobacterium damselae TaxID=38293 RepID=UPI003D7DF1BB
MNKKTLAKYATPTTIFGNFSNPFLRPFCGVFRYTDGQVCWPITDFFADIQRGQLANSSIEQYFAPLQDIVDFMSSLQSNHPCYQFTGASDEMFLGLRDWLRKNKGNNYNNIQINKRLKLLIDILFYIQDEYDVETHSGGHLIRAKGDDIPNYGVEVTRKRDRKGNEYFHHTSMLNAGTYTQRSPITELAMDEAISIIDEHSLIDSERAEYNSEVLRLSTDILEKTGIRVGELVFLEQPTLELIRHQLASEDKTLGEIATSPDSILKQNFTASEINELIQVIRTFMADNALIIWLLVITNKSTVNAGKPRLVPIEKTLAQDIVDFYDDYVLDMVDLDSVDRSLYNRSRCGYLIPTFEGEPFFYAEEVEIDASNKRANKVGKRFSSFYSNKIGQKASQKISPHLFRHKFITELVVSMMEGTDVQDISSMTVILMRVARLTGHSDPNSLWSYIEKGRIILTNRAIKKKNDLKKQVEDLLEEHGHSSNSPLAIKLKNLIR